MIAEPVTLTPVSTTVPTTLTVVETTVPATDNTVHPVQASTATSAARFLPLDIADALYHSGEIMHDMLVRLYALPALDPVLDELARRGITVRRAIEGSTPGIYG